MSKKSILIVFALISSTVSAQQFNKEERKRIESGDIAAPLHVFQVTEPGELKVLQTKSIDIAADDLLLPVLISRMFLTVRDPKNSGVGIAAPQVGINRNVIWVQRFDKEGEPFEVYINPVIVWHSKLLRKGPEGCLSIPEIRGDVLRNYTIRLHYLDKQGKFHDEMIEGFTAVIFQHEIDHLNGVLFTDRLKEQEQKTYIAINNEVNLFLENQLKVQ